MKDILNQPGIQKLLNSLSTYGQRFRRYSLPAFLVFVALIYGFVFLRVSSLSNQQPSTDAVDGQVQAANIPHIDQSVVQQLQSLQDNSVNVQTLFNQARSNPFQ